LLQPIGLPIEIDIDYVLSVQPDIFGLNTIDIENCKREIIENKVKILRKEITENEIKILGKGEQSSIRIKPSVISENESKQNFDNIKPTITDEEENINIYKYIQPDFK